MVNERVETPNSPHFYANDKIESRVTPGKIVPSSGAVISSRLPLELRHMTQKFMAPTSCTSLWAPSHNT